MKKILSSLPVRLIIGVVIGIIIGLGSADLWIGGNKADDDQRDTEIDQ